MGSNREFLKKIKEKKEKRKKIKNISRNFSGAVAVNVGSVQFQIAPSSSTLLDIYRPLPV